MNQALADLLVTVLYKHAEQRERLRALVALIEAEELHEVPRFEPLVEAMRVAIRASTVK
jgi:hypothetical protein